MPKRAEVIAAAIQACADRNGRVEPARVVDAARNTKNPLHAEFEWNDGKAAALFRLEQAAQLIRKVRFEVSYHDISLKVPFYVSDPGTDLRCYVETTRVARDNVRSRRVLEDELARLKGALHRALSLADVFQLGSTFSAMLDLALEAERRIHEAHGDDEPEPKPRRRRAVAAADARP